DKILQQRLKSQGTLSFVVYWVFVIGAGIGGFKDFLITNIADVIFIPIYSITAVIGGIYFGIFYLGPVLQYRSIKKLIEQNKIDEMKEDVCKPYIFTETKKKLALTALIELKEIAPNEIVSFCITFHTDDVSTYTPLMIETRTITIRKYLDNIAIMWSFDKKHSMLNYLMILYFVGIFFLGYEIYNIFFIILWVFLGQNEIAKLRIIKDEAWPTGWKAMYAVAALKDLKEDESHQ
ncbi:MAG: hypothetical protein ACTSP5_10170, partial [Candidatus Heimdallarchaeota archaeon]